jgi:hypothetical protein
LDVGLSEKTDNKNNLNSSSDAQKDTLEQYEPGIVESDVELDELDGDENNPPVTPIDPDNNDNNEANERERLQAEIVEANAIYKDPTNPAYEKMSLKITGFSEKLDQCISDNEILFAAHVKATSDCNDHLEILERHKQRLVNRCLKSNHYPKLSDKARDRLERVLPRSVERVNRRYRLAQLSSCVLGDIPDQSNVDYTFNGSIEVSELNGRWELKDSSSIAGWSVRFYDKDSDTLDKNGLLELQANDIYRKDLIGTRNKHYVELDSHCPSGHSCVSTNVSMKQKIIVDNKKPFTLEFDARMRNNNPEDSKMEVFIYKRGTKKDERIALSNFKTVLNGSESPVDPSQSIPISSEWVKYSVDLGELDAGQYFLEINEIGKANTLGTLLDDISIKQN